MPGNQQPGEPGTLLGQSGPTSRQEPRSRAARGIGGGGGPWTDGWTSAEDFQGKIAQAGGLEGRH